MSWDLPDRIDDILKIATHLLPEAIWVLLALFGFVVSMLNKVKERGQGSQPQPSSPSRPRAQSQTARPSPYVPAPASGPSYGTLYTSVEEPRTSTERRRDAREDAQPTYGSHDKAVWGSVFDDPGEEPKWGFDESEWGSSFGPKKNTEPTISHG
jgi:hypothetical protein